MKTFRFGAASCVKMGAASGSLSSNFPFFPPSVPFFGRQGTQSSSFPARLLFLAQTTSIAQPYSDGFQKEAHFKTFMKGNSGAYNSTPSLTSTHRMTL